LDSKNEDIRNIIDGRNGTYWLYSVLLSTFRTSGTTVKLEFELSATAKINSISIEPASILPMTLEGITYLDNDGTYQSIDIDSVIIDRPVSAMFAPVVTTKVILTFNQKNATDIQFELKNGRDLFGLRSNLDVDIEVEDIEDTLREIITSPFLLEDVIGLGDEQTAEQLRFKEYLIGFDNITFKFVDYDSRSIFVGREKEVLYPGQAAVKVLESRPVTRSGFTNIEQTTETYGTGTSLSTLSTINDFFHGSIEYWLHKLDYSERGSLLAVNTFPVLPFGAQIVLHERLSLVEVPINSVNSVGKLRFFTRLVSPFTDIDNQVKVYRNGTLLTYEDDWSVGDVVNSPGTGDPMYAKIQIASPSLTDIYTVSYIPETSSTINLPLDDTGTLQIVDLVGDRTARVIPENSIVFSPTKGSEIIAKSRMYLSIILRRNSAKQDVTPAVEEYLLMTSKKDETKFESVA